jgi:hypothetical protein
MKLKTLLGALLALAPLAASAASGNVHPTPAGARSDSMQAAGVKDKDAIEPGARELAKAVSAKLGSSRTIRVTAEHRLDPALGVGAGYERGPIEITVERPNRLYAIQRAGKETRELAYDGKWLCLMHPQLKHYALEPLQADSIEQFADRVDQRFGFRPPLTELLARDVAAQVFMNATSARITGTEWVGWTRCERLHVEQPGMTGDLWVAVGDQLPRRLLLTATSIKGRPTWDIRLLKWELDRPVDERLFSKRPAAGSQKVKMIKGR